MITLNLTEDEKYVLQDCLCGILSVVNKNPNIDLAGKEYTTAQLKSIRSKVVDESKNNLLMTYVECLEEVVESTAHTIAMDELGDIKDYINLIKHQLA